MNIAVWTGTLQETEHMVLLQATELHGPLSYWEGYKLGVVVTKI